MIKSPSISRDFVPIDESGYFINNTSLSRISKELLTDIHLIVASIVKLLKEEDVSIYLRGSLAQGNFWPGYSDIDLIVICNKPAATEHRIRKLNAYNFTKIDVRCFDKHFVPGHILFAVNVSSLLVHGPHIIDKLEKVKADESACFTLKKVEHYSNRAIADLRLAGSMPQNAERDAFILKITSWISKKLLRAGMELVLGSTKKYSSNLRICADLICSVYPHVNEASRKVLAMYLERRIDIESHLNTISDFTAFLVKERELNLTTASCM